jgi:hypothetical protein
VRSNIKLLILALSILISACATYRVKPVVGPDGSENQLIESFTIERCYDKAREVCGGNYKIVNTSSYKDGVGSTFSLLVKCEKEIPAHHE